jgi:aconitate hydratase
LKQSGAASHFEPTTPLPYAKLAANLEAYRKRLPAGAKLSYAEKILAAHLEDPATADVRRGESYVYLKPDRVAMQDATAQMAILQFMSSGMPRTAVPTTVHCDHLIEALDKGAQEDLAAALTANAEVYNFLRSAAARYGMGFWKPGSGIIHQIVLENYAFPGGMIIGTDSHTPNAGGLGMVAVGIGGADAVDVMAGLPLELKAPKLLGVHLTGALSGWASPKDVILYIAGKLTTEGGTGYIVEYYGTGVESISATGQATICNMGAEMGATCSLFPYNTRTREYLVATGRDEIATQADRAASSGMLAADAGCVYDKVVEVDLAQIVPALNGPASPDRFIPLSLMKEQAEKNGWPKEVRVCLIGSCTNSSYEDLSRAASICLEAAAKGVKAKARLYVTPGSETIRATMERDGLGSAFRAVGGVVLANACGPCIGQWKRTDTRRGEPNCILHSYNRNFTARADGNPDTLAFIGSPEVVTAMALAGSIQFDPSRDSLVAGDGSGEFRLSSPRPVPFPSSGFASGEPVYEPPSSDPGSVRVEFDPKSERLAPLSPFPKWDGTDCAGPVLIKVQGKCTTDHISAAGPWLKFRGHLDRISSNLLMGALNADTGIPNSAINALNPSSSGGGSSFQPVSDVARAYKAAGMRWCVVAEGNYGEGSSREHAALEPRHLGCFAVIAKSFARIHESNLKKQGILALQFSDPRDYDRIRGADRVTLLELAKLEPARDVSAKIEPAAGGEPFVITLKHTFNHAQISWFKAGSALNELAKHIKK